ncbi:MAG: ABC transporter ATP-binding protein [Ruminococcaceae bacterium]|nr:ABC transporter ATP-binding protein [Oscillospiraceae bacterium]
MSKPIIEVKNVSIKYVIGDLRNIGLKEFVMKKLTRNYQVKSFVAVDSVSFSLYQGDMLGIVGTNGAGKSTLLKAITQIMVPTNGSVKVNGKIAALLELGSGFDGDLNLKENAYLRGAMLGYTRKFMDEKYPDILAFSELQEFEQRPFKQLSSGMKSRIAFSIASMMEPEILILDEVLSVGDGAFREKSEAKMREIIEKGKVTILVSHSIAQVRRMCNKVLWLDHGKQIAFGDTAEICDMYEEFLKTKKLPEKK